MSKVGRQLRKVTSIMIAAAMIISQAGIPVSAAEIDLINEMPIKSEVKDQTVESDSVSSYTVEFTYNDLQYVLNGGESVALSEILSELGLLGEATEVTVSDPGLFSASNEDGRWMVTSHKAFSSDEWMKVTIGEVTYEIAVTDFASRNWEGTENYSPAEIINMLGDSTYFGVVANDYDGCNYHSEANIAVKNISNIENYTIGNSTHTYQAIDSYYITVNKDVIGARKSGKFFFAVYKDSEGTEKIQGSDFSITTGSDGKGSCTFNYGQVGQNASRLYVFELNKEGGSPVKKGEQYGLYTVAYSANGIDGINDSMVLYTDNYIENIGERNREDIGRLIQLVDGATIYYKRSGSSFGCVTYDKNARSGSQFKESTFNGEPPVSVDNLLSSAENAAGRIANAISNGNVEVVNIIATDHGNLCSDLTRYYFGKNEDNYAVINGFSVGSKLLVINVDLTGCSSYKFNKITVNGLGTGDWSAISNQIILNPVVKTSSGYAPYEGKLDVDISSGTLIAPKCTIECTGSYCGTIIANKVIKRCEIHKMVARKHLSEQATVTVTNSLGKFEISNINSHVYDGTVYNPTVTVEFDSIPLNNTVDYILKYQIKSGTDTWADVDAENIKNVGTYRAVATGKNRTDYDGMTATKEFSITARSVTITAASEEFTYDGMAHANSTVTVTSGSLIDGDSLTASATGSVTNVSDTVTGNNPIASGYTIMHGTTDVTSNYNITAVAGTLTITPKSVTITAQDKEFTPTGSAQSWPYYDVAGLVGNDAITAVITGSITEASESPVANVVTSYEFTTGTPGNYTVTTVNGQLTMPAPPSHVHSYTSVVTTEPTCTETGTRRYTCSCGYSYTETIPALGHDYVGKITKYASAQEDGIMTYTCSRCNDSYTEVIPKHEPTIEEGIEEIKQLIDELEGDDGEHKVEVDVKTEKKDDGTTETVVTVGDEEIVKIITDEDGEEKIESNIWSIGGDGNFTYTGVAIKPEILVFDGLKRLSLGSDFTVSYKNNVNAGTKAEATVSFKGGYKGSPAIKTNFTIDQADLEKDVTAPTMIIASTGKAQKPIPEIRITESGKSLGKSDLKYTYLDSEKKEVSVIKDAGDYTVEAVPKKTGGNLTGKITVPITVNGDKTKLLSNGKVNLAKKSYVYTGKPIIPDKDTYSLTIDGTKLTEGKDYTLTVSKNIEPGKATMIFTAADGNEDGYVGSIKAVFTITKGKELKPAGDGSDFKYTYEENAPFAKGGAKPEVTVKDGDKTLTKDVDYKVSYDKNKKITEGNTAVMTVTGKGNYKGKVTLYYAVVPQDIAAFASGIEVQDKAVSSKGYKNPKVTITDENGKKLSKNNDYEFVDDYTEPEKDGNVTVTIKGKGAYMGTVPVTYRYLEAAALIDKVNASKIADKTYTGSPIRLTKKEAAKLLYTGKGKDINYLTWGEDFEIVRYENNTKTGTAKVILRGIGTHGGTRTVTFKIKSAKKTGLKIIISKLFNK